MRQPCRSVAVCIKKRVAAQAMPWVGRRAGRLTLVSPLITLTSDFGTTDSYVAELKGVLFALGPPDLRVVDLSHQLPPFDIQAAALFLRAALPRFPPGTIHVAIIDPGVGSPRAPLVVQLGSHLLVGPDNGQFGYLYDGAEQVYAIDVASTQRPISSTFHGRDLFAPAAAQLANGRSPGQLGARVDSYQHLVFPMVEYVGESLIGRVIHIDRFGNLISNISESALRSFLGSEIPHAVVSLGEKSVSGISDHYAQVEPGGMVALIGSSGLLELAVREGNASNKLSAGLGKQLRVQRGV